MVQDVFLKGCEPIRYVVKHIKGNAKLDERIFDFKSSCFISGSHGAPSPKPEKSVRVSGIDPRDRLGHSIVPVVLPLHGLRVGFACTSESIHLPSSEAVLLQREEPLQREERTETLL